MAELKRFLSSDTDKFPNPQTQRKQIIKPSWDLPEYLPIPLRSTPNRELARPHKTNQWPDFSQVISNVKEIHCVHPSGLTEAIVSVFPFLLLISWARWHALTSVHSFTQARSREETPNKF